MKSTDLRAKARAIFGSAVAEPMPNQPNGAKALQQRANARPIPTYKVGGVVKKADGGAMPKLSAAERKMGDALMMKRKGKEVMDAQKRMESDKEMMRRKKQEAADKLLGIKMKSGGKACGGKAGKYAEGGDITAERVAARMAAGNYKKGGKVARYKDGSGYRKGFEPRAGESDAERLKRETEFLKAKAEAEGTRSRQQRAEDEKIGFTYQKPVAPKPGYRRGFEPRPGESDAERLKRELEFLKAKAERKKDGGKVQTSADTAKKLATEMGGMKKGGKAKDGLAVMIAIGKPMKKPVKKAVGGAGKTRKGMAPIKKAQGGAAKVRKGMMSETGDIKQVVKPKKGIGGM